MPLTTILLQYSYNTLTILLKYSYNTLTILLQYSYNTLTILLQYSDHILECFRSPLNGIEHSKLYVVGRDGLDLWMQLLYEHLTVLISEKSWNIIRATVMQNSRVQNPALIPQILPSCSSLLAPYSRLKKWVVCENKTGLLGLNVNCSYILTSYWQWFFFSLYFWIKSNLYKLLRSFG